MALKPVTVTQLNEYIARVLTTDPILGNVTVQGEISTITFHSTGHVYFSIKDDNSKLNCFLPASYVKYMPEGVETGSKVNITGYINVYKKGGTYTFFVRSIELEGIGDLAKQFEELKEKLNSEGLFSPEFKKPIPKFPKKVGVITSETGAAIQDISKIVRSRTNMVQLILFPALVQGDGAANDIANTIRFVNENFDDIDTLIVGRGGGSKEDLWCFNEEVVARAIFDSRIPIISAVGHEIDFSISDFVADMRAETPTAAAEIAVPDDETLKLQIEKEKNLLLSQLKRKVEYERLVSSNAMENLKDSMNEKLKESKDRIDKIKLVLEERNPMNVLGRGFSILSDDSENLVSSINDFLEDKEYKINFKDGSKKFKPIDVK